MALVPLLTGNGIQCSDFITTKRLTMNNTETVLISFVTKGAWKLKLIPWIIKVIDKINIPSFRKRKRTDVVINFKVIIE
jgi:hypothetical protein